MSFYDSKTECLKHSRKKTQTNIRYKNFTQEIYTAGDEEQFYEKMRFINGNLTQHNINTDDNMFNDFLLSTKWLGYENLECTALANTFNYMFHKFKKGIYIKILNNKVDIFLPFSKANYINEWHHKIQVDYQKYNNFTDFIQHISKMEGRNFNPNAINKFPNSWYGNNALLRYEYPIAENDTNVSIIKNLLDELCEHREIPDIEFFINRRDFPILKQNLTEPYNHLWDSSDMPLISHNYEKYLPIFSMCKTDEFVDILFPTVEDWARIQSTENKWFPSMCKDFVFDFHKILWHSKKTLAVFRGSSTGIGTTIDTNNRLKLAYMSTISSRYLDAGITKWNLRPRKIQNQKYLQTIDVSTLPFGLVKQLTPIEQAHYKYIVNVDGHVSAYRLSLELSMGCVILLVSSKYKLWFTNYLIPYTHFVPVKDDLSNLIDQIKWCINNDKLCEKIASNARQFYNQYLQKKGIFDYFQKLIIDTKQTTGSYLYNFISQSTLQLIDQQQILKQFHFNSTTKLLLVEKSEKDHQSSRTFNMLNDNKTIVDNFLCKEEHDVEELSIFKNQTTIVTSFSIHNTFSVVKKRHISSSSQDTKTPANNLIHEAFVGLTSTNKLLKCIPNFVYTFGLYDNFILTEKIDGSSLFQFIQNDTVTSKFTLKNFLQIILEISLALHIAQNECGFVHYDMAPWNIMLLENVDQISYDYVLRHDYIVRVKTNLIPIIIDYGKSHVLYENMHYGTINPYKINKCQDIITLLITSLTQICKYQTLNHSDIKDVLTLANFIANTKYLSLRLPHNKQRFTHFTELKQFLHNAHKYDDILNSNKYELEDKTPLDLYEYILKNFKYKFNVENVFTYKNNMQTNITSEVFHDDGITLPNEKILAYYYIQQLLRNGQSHEILSTYFDKICNMENSKLFCFEKHFMLDENLQCFDETTFLLPEKMHNLVVNIKKPLNFIHLKELLENILLNDGPFKVIKKDRLFIYTAYDRLLNTDFITLKTCLANFYTMRNRALCICKTNMEHLQTIEYKHKHKFNDIIQIIDDMHSEE